MPSQAILNTYTGPASGRDINPPLNMAKDLMDKYEKSYDSFVLVLMTYGNADYPSQGVENIKKSPAKGKLKFKSIAYGGGSES